MMQIANAAFRTLTVILVCGLFFISCVEDNKIPGKSDMPDTAESGALSTESLSSVENNGKSPADLNKSAAESGNLDWRYSYTGTAAGVQYAVNSTSDGQQVAVTFWDSDGNRLFSRLYDGWREVNITEETKQILSVSRGVGSGLWYAWYFDNSTGFISAEFECPYTVKAPYAAVACVPQEDGTRQLHIFNVFNRDGYSYFADLDFSETANPSDALREVKFLDNTHILVTYLSGTNFEIKQAELEVPFMDFENYMPEIYTENFQN